MNRLLRRRHNAFYKICEDFEFTSILYVGAHIKKDGSISYLDYLKKRCKRIELLEAFRNNYLECKSKFSHAYLGDIRNIDIITNKKYSSVMWLHGPEHIERQELDLIFKKVEPVYSKLFLMSCPWGICPQGESYDNPYERHQCALYPHFFIQRGFKVKLMGLEDKPESRSQIIAWKEK